jgi:hypothetical protein
VKASVYIPQELEQKVQTYLEGHPNETLSSLVQDALESKLQPRPNRILELAGFVDSRTTKPRALEQIQQDQRERPEDESIKRRQDRR